MSEDAFTGDVWEVYGDESRQTRDRYMVIGGVILPSRQADSLHSAVNLFRESNRMHATLKWTKVSNQKFQEYRNFVDLFFSFSRVINFRCMVLDTSLIDHETYSGGDRELGFYKFMYQFLVHSLRRYIQPGERALVRLDRRVTTYKLSDLAAVLNAGLKRYLPKMDYAPVRSIEPRQCSGSDLLQIADVLLGAVGFQWNAYHARSEAKRAKVLLAEHIANRANLVSLTQATPRGKADFSIWPFRLRNKKRPGS